MRIWGALDCSSLILIWLLLGERDQSWNPQKKKYCLMRWASTDQEGPSVCHAWKPAWCFTPPEGICWAQSESRQLTLLCGCQRSHCSLHQPRTGPSMFWWLGNLWAKSYRGLRGVENGCWKSLNFAGFLWYSYTFARMYSKHLVLLLVTCTVVC